MNKTILIVIVGILSFGVSDSISQNLSSDKPHIAVLEFDSQGLSKGEAKSLTDRFRGELVNTNELIVLEREKIDAILNEQGFQQSGCTSTECAVEVGKILNLEKIVVGNIGKVGDTYIVDVSYIDIESSRIENSFKKDHEGRVDGLIPIFREIALEMVYEIDPLPSSPLYISGVVAIGSVAVGTYSYLQAEKSYQSYKDATTLEDANRFKEDTEKYDKITLIAAVGAGVCTITYFVYKHLYNRSLKPEGFYATPYIPNGKTVGLAVGIRF
jgi:hypothetical protein